MKPFFMFGSLCLALLLVNVFVSNVHADERTLTGTVAVEKGDDGEVKSISLTLDDGSSVSAKVDENGKKLGAELSGKKAEVKGDVVEQDEKKTITVASFKSAEAKAEAEAEGNQ